MFISNLQLLEPTKMSAMLFFFFSDNTRNCLEIYVHLVDGYSTIRAGYSDGSK